MPLKVDIKWSAPEQSDFKLEASFASDAKVNAVFGPSGAGKSSLLNLIAGLLQPESGEIIVEGETLYDHQHAVSLPVHRRRIGYVFQDGRLFPHLTVSENLEYAKSDKRSAALSFDNIVALLEIGNLLKRRPDSLSGGERQRVALGRALRSEPRILLLDEPLAAVEQGLRDQILSFLERIRDELSIPMLYVSHSLEELLRLTRSFIVMEQGKVIASGSYFSLLQDERVFRLAERLGLINVLPITDTDAAGQTATFSGTTIHLPRLPSTSAGLRNLSLRPRDIILARTPPEGLSVQNALPGTIAAIAHSEGRVLVRVKIGEDAAELIAEVTPRAAEDLALAVDGKITCLFKATALEGLQSCRLVGSTDEFDQDRAGNAKAKTTRPGV